VSASRLHVHSSRIPVRWGDMDAYNHVNNTIYFRYCEQARVEWCEKLGFAVRTHQPTGPVIINAACTFLLPIGYPATVLLDMYAGEPGRSSLMTWFEMRVEGDDRVHAEGSAKMVWMDHATGGSVPLPAELRAMFEGG